MKKAILQVIGILIMFLAMIFAIAMCSSCSTTNQLTEDLFEHNKNDLKVLEYKDHKATVLVMPDSVVKTIFIIKPLSKGYLICEKR